MEVLMSVYRYAQGWRVAFVCALFLSAAGVRPLAAGSAKADEERLDKDPAGKFSSRFYPLALQAERGERPGRWVVC
jgi:hypothetical protein